MLLHSAAKHAAKVQDVQVGTRTAFSCSGAEIPGTQQLQPWSSACPSQTPVCITAAATGRLKHFWRCWAYLLEVSVLHGLPDGAQRLLEQVAVQLLETGARERLAQVDALCQRLNLHTHLQTRDFKSTSSPETQITCLTKQVTQCRSNVCGRAGLPEGPNSLGCQQDVYQTQSQ